MKKWLASLLPVLVGCSVHSDFGSQPPHSSQVAQMSATERQRLVPNSLFAAVYDNALPLVQALAMSRPAELEAQDKNGDTALGTALRLGYGEIARALLQRTTLDHLNHRNGEGQGYVFLAAATNQTEMITAMGNALYDSLGGWQRYHFGDLDQPDRIGERALFVAADRVVAETLEIQYYRGWLKYPWWKFMMRLDQKRRTFLHAAAAAGRADVLAWASERLCADSNLKSSSHVYFRYPARALSLALRGFETFIGDPDSPVDLLVNRSDQDGNTALHAAVSARQWSSMRALASCQWLDFDPANRRRELPLHLLLHALHGRDAPAAAEDHQAFDFLLAQTTWLRPWWTQARRINFRDQDGNTALHLAAALNDTYFYQELARRGDIYAVNKQGVTPQILFERTRQALDLHGK